jgi:hypothetical protein
LVEVAIENDKPEVKESTQSLKKRPNKLHVLVEVSIENDKPEVKESTQSLKIPKISLLRTNQIIKTSLIFAIGVTDSQI